MLRYKCSICGTLDGNEIPFETPVCCGMEKEITQDGYAADAPLVEIFNEGPYEHLGPTPMRFSSKKSLRKFCREKDLRMDYVE